MLLPTRKNVNAQLASRGHHQTARMADERRIFHAERNATWNGSTIGVAPSGFERDPSFLDSSPEQNEMGDARFSMLSARQRSVLLPGVDSDNQTSGEEQFSDHAVGVNHSGRDSLNAFGLSSGSVRRGDARSVLFSPGPENTTAVPTERGCVSERFLRYSPTTRGTSIRRMDGQGDLRYGGSLTNEFFPDGTSARLPDNLRYDGLHETCYPGVAGGSVVNGGIMYSPHSLQNDGRPPGASNCFQPWDYGNTGDHVNGPLSDGTLHGRVHLSDEEQTLNPTNPYSTHQSTHRGNPVYNGIPSDLETENRVCYALRTPQSQAQSGDLMFPSRVTPPRHHHGQGSSSTSFSGVPQYGPMVDQHPAHNHHSNIEGENDGSVVITPQRKAVNGGILYSPHSATNGVCPTGVSNHFQPPVESNVSPNSSMLQHCFVGDHPVGGSVGGAVGGSVARSIGRKQPGRVLGWGDATYTATCRKRSRQTDSLSNRVPGSNATSNASITLDELMQLVTANPAWLAVDVFNNGFIFERGGEQYKTRDRDNQLTKLGHFSAERWQYIEEVHYVFPGRFQLYHARSTLHPHGQVPFSRFLNFVKSYQGVMPKLFLYQPVGQYSNHFLYVDQDHNLCSSVRWGDVPELVNKKKPMSDGRAKNAVDFGYSTFQSSSRRSDTTGHATPNMKPDTMKPSVVDVFLKATDYMLEMADPEWNGQRLIPETNPLSSKIHPRNVMHTARASITTTDESTLCGLHCDRSNSERESDVLGLSTIHNGVRLAWNFQNKKCIEQLYHRISTTDDVFSDVMEFYAGLPENRRDITADLLAGEKMNVHGMDMVHNRCNLDPLSYAQPFLYATAEFVSAHKLSLIEITSLQCGACFLSGSKFFYAIAMRMLMDQDVYRALRAHEKGIFIGHSCVKLARTLLAGYTQPKTIFRFNNYVAATLPSRGSGTGSVSPWEQYVLDNLRIQCYVFKGYTKPAKSQKPAIYTKLVALLGGLVKGAGVLTTNHSIADKACLGLLPSWMREFAEIDTESYSVKYYRKAYRKSSDELKPAALPRFVDSLATEMATRFDKSFNRRYLENVFCKHVRTVNNGDGRWRDVIFANQALFSFPDTDFCEIIMGEKKFHMQGPYVLNEFPYGDGLASMESIVEHLNIASTLPDIETIRAFEMPETLLRPDLGADFEFKFVQDKTSSDLKRQTRLFMRRCGLACSRL